MESRSHDQWQLEILFAEPYSHYNLNYAIVVVYNGHRPNVLSGFENIPASEAPEFVASLVRESAQVATQWKVDKRTELVLESEGADFFRMLDADPSSSTIKVLGLDLYGNAPKKDEGKYQARCPLVPISNDAAIAFFATFPSKRVYSYESQRHTATALVAVAGIVVASYSIGFICDLTLSAWNRVCGGDGKAPEGQFFRRIFASYSRKDVEIVKLVDSIVRSFGVGDLRWDLKILHAGENWEGRILEEIDQADQFQLFWSTNSKRSAQVRNEWKYALGLDRSGFIRPVYWESPLPKPARALNHLHFEHLGEPQRFL